MSTRAQTRQSFNSRKLELRSKKTINKTTWTRFQCSKIHDILAALKQDGGFSEKTSMKGSPWSKDSVHLENGQRVYFRQDNAMDRAHGPPPATTLTAFFQLCNEDQSAIELKYPEVPEQYTWQ
ncbi:hypothetical protein ACOMHN_002427 [Nucella lapillus]